MKVLAIESSADETAAAVVERTNDGFFVRIISSVTATSLAKHKATKGIVPEVAAREQIKVIMPVLAESLKDVDVADIDAIAVTTGPGLIGSLLVGVETARALAYAWNKPVIPVRHILAHPYANFIQLADQTPPQFPILSWVISGGHTQLTLMKSHQEMEVLGHTVDDAAGECFDKCARLLGFDYPGGPFIEKLAAEDSPGFQLPRPLPRPMIHEKNLLLSFSGLKTAFSQICKELGSQLDQPEVKQALATELQQAITDVIVAKTKRAFDQHPEIESVIISGGVSANKFLSEALQQLSTNHQKQYFSPPLSLCTDNAAMIGAYAAFHQEAGQHWKDIAVQL
jgi:N6-L-threonylcarbamoyladenine synthase